MGARKLELVQLLKEILNEDEAPAGKPIRELWLAWSNGMKQQGKAVATMRSIDSQWKHLELIIGDMPVEKITGELWTNVIIPQVRIQSHPGFVFANMRKWLSMNLKWSEENGKGPQGWRRPRLIDVDPEREAGRAYSIEETGRLETNSDWLLKPKIVMALDHFMRRSEISLLSKERVDRSKRIIHLRAIDTKIRRARSFPYNDRLEELFVAMDLKHAELGIVSPFMFPSPLNASKSIGRGGFQTAWETCKRLSGVIGKFHWLRHTALTRAFRGGGNPALICQMAGLDISMAQKVYLHFDTEDLREVLAKKAA